MSTIPSVKGTGVAPGTFRKILDTVGRSADTGTAGRNSRRRRSLEETGLFKRVLTMTGPCIGRRLSREEKTTEVPAEPKSTQISTGSEDSTKGSGRTFGRIPAVWFPLEREKHTGKVSSTAEYRSSEVRTKSDHVPEEERTDTVKGSEI